MPCSGRQRNEAGVGGKQEKTGPTERDGTELKGRVNKDSASARTAERPDIFEICGEGGEVERGRKRKRSRE